MMMTICVYFTISSSRLFAVILVLADEEKYPKNRVQYSEGKKGVKTAAYMYHPT